MLVLGNTVPSEHTAGRIFDVNGISPTVMYRNSKVIQILEGNNKPILVGAAMRGRYNKDGKIEQQLELRNDETSNAITTVHKDSLVVENFQKPPMN